MIKWIIILLLASCTVAKPTSKRGDKDSIPQGPVFPVDLTSLSKSVSELKVQVADLKKKQDFILDNTLYPNLNDFVIDSLGNFSIRKKSSIDTLKNPGHQ